MSKPGKSADGEPHVAQDSTTASDATSPTPRKRGRPKKTSLPASKTTSAVEEENPKHADEAPPPATTTPKAGSAKKSKSSAKKTAIPDTTMTQSKDEENENNEPIPSSKASASHEAKKTGDKGSAGTSHIAKSAKEGNTIAKRTTLLESSDEGSGDESVVVNTPVAKKTRGRPKKSAISSTPDKGQTKINFSAASASPAPSAVVSSTPIVKAPASSAKKVQAATSKPHQDDIIDGEIDLDDTPTKRDAGRLKRNNDTPVSTIASESPSVIKTKQAKLAEGESPSTASSAAPLPTTPAISSPKVALPPKNDKAAAVTRQPKAKDQTKISSSTASASSAVPVPLPSINPTLATSTKKSQAAATEPQQQMMDTDLEILDDTPVIPALGRLKKNNESSSLSTTSASPSSNQAKLTKSVEASTSSIPSPMPTSSAKKNQSAMEIDKPTDKGDGDGNGDSELNTPTKQARGRPKKGSAPAPPPNPGALSPYKLKKQEEEKKRSRAIWSPPVTPLRLSRGLTDFTIRNNYSIAQHFDGYRDSFDKILKTFRKRSSYTPFPNWTCELSHIKVLEEDKLREYACGENEPVNIEFTHLPPKMASETFAIPRHASHRKDSKGSDFILNTGGPAMDIAWCPLPWEPAEPNEPSHFLRHSFLAVSSLKSHHQALKIEPFSGTPNMIQLWDLGSISQFGEHTSASFTPFLSIAIAHRFTQVKHMTWCPIATPQPQSVDDFKLSRKAQLSRNTNPSQSMDIQDDGEECFPRLGLLAVAFGDGKAAIFAIPHPHALHLHYHNDMYDRRTILLQLQPVMELATPDQSPLAKLAWSHHGDAQNLAGGTIDGKLAVWRLPLHKSGNEAGEGENIEGGYEVDCPIQMGPVLIRDDQEEGMEGADETATRGAIGGRDLSSSKGVASRSAGVGKRTESSGKSSNAPEERVESELNSSNATSDEILLGLASPQASEPVPLVTVDSSFVPFFYRGTHDHVTTGLEWHPVNGDLLAVGTLSQYTSIWNTRKPNSSVHTVMLQGSVCSELVFGGSETDYAYMVAGDSSEVRLVLPPTQKSYPLHLGPCQTVDYSNMLKLRVSGGIDGLVYLTALVEAKKLRKHSAHFLQARDPIGAWIDHIAVKQDLPPEITKTADKKAENGNHEAQTVKKEMETNNTAPTPTAAAQTTTTKNAAQTLPTPSEISPFPQPITFTYSATNCANFFASNYTITPNSRNKEYPNAQVTMLQRPEFYHQASFITKVRWCPNIFSPSWLATASRSGLVRIQLLEWATPAVLKDGFPKFHGK